MSEVKWKHRRVAEGCARPGCTARMQSSPLRKVSALLVEYPWWRWNSVHSFESLVARSFSRQLRIQDEHFAVLPACKRDSVSDVTDGKQPSVEHVQRI